MIAYVSGKLVQKDPAFVIIDANGIGYRLKISLNTYAKVGSNEALKLHTYFMVKEDSQELYGFYELSEKILFEQLISISGVGGNTALTILSSITPAELQQAIDAENVGMLKSVKGIGPKTAGRIILELKGKLKLDGVDSGTGATVTGVREEALSALVSLGFPRAQMEKKVATILGKHPDAEVEEIIKLALRA